MSHSTNYPPSIGIELGKSHDCEEEFKIRKSSEEKLTRNANYFRRT